MAAVRQKQEEKTRTLKVTRFFTYDPLIAGTVFCRSSTFSFLSMLNVTEKLHVSMLHIQNIPLNLTVHIL